MEEIKLDDICIFCLFSYCVIVGTLFELTYYYCGIIIIKICFFFLLNFFIEIDSYESTSRVYESSLLTPHESI